jgi:hypothetical protein
MCPVVIFPCSSVLVTGGRRSSSWMFMDSTVETSAFPRSSSEGGAGIGGDPPLATGECVYVGIHGASGRCLSSDCGETGLLLVLRRICVLRHHVGRRGGRRMPARRSFALSRMRLPNEYRIPEDSSLGATVASCCNLRRHGRCCLWRQPCGAALQAR